MPEEVQVLEPSSARPRPSYWRRLAVIALFLLPVAYFAEILAVAIHEIAGHGLTALCVGGAFTGFTLKWDGMGWACAFPAPNAPVSNTMAILAAGVTATTLSGIGFFVLALLLRKRFFLRMLLLLLSMMSVLEGTSYAFWNAYHPVPVGDIGRILTSVGSPLLRWTLMIVGGGLMAVATIVLNALIFQGVEQWLGEGGRLRGFERGFTLTVVIVIPGTAGGFLFDWNQVAPGIGLWPNFVGALAEWAVAAGLYSHSLKVTEPAPPMANARVPLIAAWTVTAGTILAMWRWLSDGVYWG